MQGIKHIIFDLGGVLLNIDYQLTEEAFVKLGMQDFAEKYTQAQQIDFFSKYEKGLLSTKDFIAKLKTWLPNPVAHTEIVDAWNAMLLDFPLRRLQILQQLQLHYDIVLLSNTNELHEEAFNQKLKEVCGYNKLAVFFDRVYFSHHIGMRKPEAAIFEHVLADTGFDPRHTLFIDDSQQHIVGASELGIQTIWLEKGMSIEEHIFKPKVEQ